jgi:Cu-processing system permease protein
MRACFIIALATFRELTRYKISLLIPLLTLGIFCIGALLSSVSLGDHILVLRDFSLLAISLSGIGVTLFSGVSLLSKELKSKTILNVLSKPLERSSFLLGKFFGLVLAGSSVCAIIALILCVLLGDGTLILGAFCAINEIILLSAVTLFFSCIVVTPMLAGVFSGTVFLVGRALQAVLELTQIPDSPAASLQPILKTFSYFIPDFSSLALYDSISQNGTIPFQILLSGTLYAVAYSAIILFIGTLFFERRDFQ